MEFGEEEIDMVVMVNLRGICFLITQSLFVKDFFFN